MYNIRAATHPDQVPLTDWEGKLRKTNVQPSGATQVTQTI